MDPAVPAVKHLLGPHWDAQRYNMTKRVRYAAECLVNAVRRELRRLECGRYVLAADVERFAGSEVLWVPSIPTRPRVG